MKECDILGESKHALTYAVIPNPRFVSLAVVAVREIDGHGIW